MSVIKIAQLCTKLIQIVKPIKFSIIEWSVNYKDSVLQCQTLKALTSMIKLIFAETNSFTWKLKRSQLN